MKFIILFAFLATFARADYCVDAYLTGSKPYGTRGTLAQFKWMWQGVYYERKYLFNGGAQSVPFRIKIDPYTGVTCE